MKVSEIARFSSLRAQEKTLEQPVITTYKTTVQMKQLIAVITANPGASVHDIRQALHLHGGKASTLIASRLHYAITTAKKPRIKRQRLDGAWRYYPINYNLLTDAKARAQPVVPQQPNPLAAPAQVIYTEAPKQDITSLAMEFFWETGSRDLKEFVEWTKHRTT